MTRYRDISEFAQAFASEFKGFMKANSITNLQLAARLGRNDGYISERANGKRPLDADDVDALASLVQGWTGRDLMIELSRRVRVGLAPQTADASATARPNLTIVAGMSEDEATTKRQDDYARVAEDITENEESGEDADNI